ncbi:MULTISPECIES: ABC transporter substrate-binding protein [Streptomyces]|uniref:NitT/TauT family transport system substrate-binding protein n=1 Tax=Streptomyces stelliscabiei TaxID=146820 RepID=A0A8I0PAU8_9ACTN|nr:MULTISPECIES: ABC transporter substrate-binding protein [Streptomyces]KND46073.1 ABC transporter substrate-binding protein [Streptomyces stelliscabiei]MBE1599324.1 NitT/TauT family transport system substrate-binding protein [Streptomyces stelliscabiei]MDX2520214.1 ABC transporter substrate-binding protein [Streptomyces stelliscabiei]MDX2557004.1 ABC transporter substrate-binding protein [Streptomyces stelliscabiei]MDX2615898.1 ABC transporter substrate-binding protein [Streptomyces stellisc
MKTKAVTLATALLLPLTLTACGNGSDTAADGGTVTVTVGYQSKTINTVTAGTLLRSLGYFEDELNALGGKTTYKVDWQDYATGAPITAQMTAGKIDIGSMGDFPLLLNAARGKQLGKPTRLVAATGYNLRGGLNTIVTTPDSKLSTLKDLKGRKVSTSIGSAADGTLVRALNDAGLDADKDIEKLNQQPAVGASALSAGSTDALSQFVAWPGLLTYQGKAKALYDGAQLDLPTFHGVTAREDFAKQRPAVLEAFLKAQAKATDYLNEHPVEAAEKVADATGLPAEVVYLYNGAHGIATFDPALKPALIAALKKDVPILRAAKLTGDVDVDAFVDDRYVRKALGSAAYDKRLAAEPAPAASEVWPKNATETRSFQTPAGLLAYVAGHKDAIRAAYVPDATTGTQWFADKAVWVADGDRLLPFVAPATAKAYVAGHDGAETVTYAAALERAS